MEENNIFAYFSDLSATIRSNKEIQKIYNPQLAFNFNSLNFLRPGENKYSELLAFFLNPNAAHGQGAIFLKLFLKHVGLDDKVSETDFAHVKCKCEHGIDKQRRIDILITFGHTKFVIGIENKVWAKDQINQLKDYNKWLKENSENYCLLYLTPYRNEPHEISIRDSDSFKELEEQGLFKLIGYTDHIIDCVHDWALNCQAERVRSFLLDFEQYLKKQFLGETFMDESQTIANHALKSTVNLEVAFATANALNQIKQMLFIEFNQQLTKLAEEKNLKRIGELNISNGYTYVHFKGEFWKNLKIGFQFDNTLNFSYGVCYDEPLKALTLIEQNLLYKFQKQISNEDYWLFICNDFQYSNWSNDPRPWIEINNGEMKVRFGEILHDYSKKISEVLSNVETGI